MSDFPLQHPWMTFFLVLAALATLETWGEALVRRRCPECRGAAIREGTR